MVSRTKSVSLRAVLPEARTFPARDFRVKSLSADHRRVTAGDVYVALAKAEIDGHDFARDAVAAGASAVISEHILAAPVPVFVVPDSREAYGRLCQALAGNPTTRMPTIGTT